MPEPAIEPPVDSRRYRLTIRSDDIELRGTIATWETVEAVAAAFEPLGAMVYVSVIDDTPETPR